MQKEEENRLAGRRFKYQLSQLIDLCVITHSSNIERGHRLLSGAHSALIISAMRTRCKYTAPVASRHSPKQDHRLAAPTARARCSMRNSLRCHWGVRSASPVAT